VQYFIGVVPPTEISERIIGFQKRWKSNRITEMVEPHITVKAPVGLTDDEAWISRARERCRSFYPFIIKLGNPASFGSDVTYLSVNSVEIHELHRLLLSIFSTSLEDNREWYELDYFVPHLTLGMVATGMSADELQEMKRAANPEFSAIPHFTARFVRIFRAISGDVFRPYLDVKLSEE
jgi:2'-5' RNA ligase